MKKRKVKIPLIIAVILGVISLSLFLFPLISNAAYQSENQSKIVAYNNNISTLSKAEKEKYLEQAEEYNQSLTETVNDAFIANTYEDIRPEYESVLNFDDGQICSIEIPKINVKLPVYHGTYEDVLSKGAAHSANTSFPIGGENTHAVISAHTAYPGKVFFDDLDELEIGDEFCINVLDEKLTYKVCDIDIVNPDDTDKLQIVYGKDLVTLVTCYPYAVNTHRLLVTGERVFNSETNAPLQTESNHNNNYNLIIIFTIIALTVVLIATIIFIAKKHKVSLGGTVERND